MWGASECCSNVRFDRDRVDESRGADPVEEASWHGDEVSPSATATVEDVEWLAGGLISVLMSARVLLLRETRRMVARGTDTEGLTE